MDMKLILNPSEYIHQKDKSTYNHNYYKSEAFEILEICHEDYQFYEFRLINGEKWEFLGCGSNGFWENGVVEIDFRQFYS